MSVRLTDDVVWLNECHDVGDGSHEHVSVYLVEAGDSSILVDSGSFHHRESIREEIEAVTDGAGLDAMMLSHSDLPHSANVRPFTAAWDDVDLLVSTGSPTQGLPESAVTVEPGTTTTVLGREFSFVDPPLADRNHTMWIYDHGSGVLFTVDGFGSYHAPGNCGRTSERISDIDYDSILQYHEDALVWLGYVDPEKLRSALDDILGDHEISYLAPVHGPPIAGAALEDYLDLFMEAVREISDDFTVPTQG